MDGSTYPTREKGNVIWITGLSGSGKTTLAKALLPFLPQPRVLLDGDDMRHALSLLAGGFEYDDRKRLAYTYARLCCLLAKQGMVVVCATISMFHEVREWNRRNFPGYFEIYLEASMHVLRERDYKKVYKANALSEEGESEAAVVGVHIDPELPANPDIHFCQPGLSTNEMVAEIVARLTIR